jgi:hypothetical protein
MINPVIDLLSRDALSRQSEGGVAAPVALLTVLPDPLGLLAPPQVAEVGALRSALANAILWYTLLPATAHLLVRPDQKPVVPVLILGVIITNTMAGLCQVLCLPVTAPLSVPASKYLSSTLTFFVSANAGTVAPPPLWILGTRVGGVDAAVAL